MLNPQRTKVLNSQRVVCVFLVYHAYLVVGNFVAAIS